MVGHQLAIKRNQRESFHPLGHTADKFALFTRAHIHRYRRERTIRRHDMSMTAGFMLLIPGRG
jgi:hypothetical protein